ncbi:DUF6471 domain-containing protein [Alteromonas sp. ASW11-130]|uniref:DUF6471 domain-containing protein n=1 Tax=Alteromonas sp. ASW11-130 TaxID=3015775 RepID=UPI002241C836|nr:DUF6471 domain-containing protein [Alteromonas sp. ASW11-130]MCW8091320.1 DUF6471 domain-containing protein [Alteromonas sp. ASW11-130]
MEKQNWRELVQRVIKTEMSFRGVKYQALSQRLEENGIIQTADNLRNKVNKGIMGADLFLQILVVLNARPLNVADMQEIMGDLSRNTLEDDE